MAFGIPLKAPHPGVVIAVYFSPDSAQAVLDVAEEINHDPPSTLALPMLSEMKPGDSDTHPGTSNAMPARDVEILRDQRAEIARRWHDRITR